MSAALLEVEGVGRQFVKPGDGVDGDGDGDRDRHRRHDRRWRFHQLRVHHVEFFPTTALGRGGNCRAVWGALLRRAWSYVSALERRVQFSRALLSSNVWISRGLGLRHGRVRRTDCTRRHGVWRIFSKPSSREFRRLYWASRFAGLSRSFHGLSLFQCTLGWGPGRAA